MKQLKTCFRSINATQNHQANSTVSSQDKEIIKRPFRKINEDDDDLEGKMIWTAKEAKRFAIQ